MSRYRKGFIFSLLLWLPHLTYAQNPAVVRWIEISSTYLELGSRISLDKAPGRSGASDPSRTDLLIRKEGGAYYLGDNVVDAGLIADLVKSLNAPVNSELNIEDLGITPAWLKANAPSVAQNIAAGTLLNGGPVHEVMLESAFADPATIDKVVPELFDDHHYFCADCKHYSQYVKVSVGFEDGTSQDAWSYSQFPYMLPWHLVGKNPAASAYNAGISRAIAALMPEESMNRSRLSGENLAMALGRIIMFRVERQAQLLDVESKTGGTFSALRSRYTIESANIKSWGDPVLRKREQPETDELNLYLHLQASDPPHNFFYDDVSLQYLDGNVVGTEKFLQDSPQFEKLVLSVPWLNQYVQEQRPKTRIGISFFHGVSFSEPAMKIFAADMRAMGRDDLIAKVEAAKDRIALLIVGSGEEESDWLVYPDQHMLLWRFWQIPVYGKPSLLKFKPSDFARVPCAAARNTPKPRNSFLGCVGIQIPPDGTLAPLH
jgi:hypothetical protein